MKKLPTTWRAARRRVRVNSPHRRRSSRRPRLHAVMIAARVATTAAHAATIVAIERDDRGPRRDDRGPRRDDRGGPHRDSRPGMTHNKPLIQDVSQRGRKYSYAASRKALALRGRRSAPT